MTEIHSVTCAASVMAPVEVCEACSWTGLTGMGSATCAASVIHSL